MWTRRMAEPRRRLDSGTAPSRGSFKPGTRAYAVQAQPACNDAPSWERHSSLTLPSGACAEGSGWRSTEVAVPIRAPSTLIGQSH